MTGELALLVPRLKYKDGWAFRLESGRTSAMAGTCEPLIPGQLAATAGGLAVTWGEPVFLVICVTADDTSRPGQTAAFMHRFLAPDDPGISWHRWAFDRIRDVERHESMEAFAVGADRPFYPEHGTDADLYGINDRGLTRLY